MKKFFPPLIFLLFSLNNFAQTCSLKCSVKEGCSPLLVKFSVTVTGGKTIKSYEWDYDNDGNMGSGFIDTEYKYTTSGNYLPSVKVNFTDGTYCIAIASDSIHVWGSPRASFGFPLNPIQCLDGNSFDFLCKTSYGIYGHPIVKYLWSFGDGDTSSTQNPTHHFKVKGNFNVTLTVIDSKGCQFDTTASIKVAKAPDTSVFLIGATITSSASPDWATYKWIDCNNGDSAIAGEVSQTFTPKVSGSYAVIVSQYGCTDTSTCVNVTVTGLPETISKSHPTLHPNPAHATLTIQTQTHSQTQTLLTITNPLGQTFYKETIPHTQTQTPSQNIVDVSLFPKGIYFVSLVQGGERSVQKIIIE